jgi:FkbM family methyltransferase
MRALGQTIINRIKGKMRDSLKKQLLFSDKNPASTPAPIEVERAEQTFYINYLREGMVAFDVGASIGELTLLFSRFVQQSGKVFSFEACRATFDKLASIYNLSGRNNVELNHMALSDSNGTLELYVYPEKYAGWNTLANRPLASYGIDVKPVKREQVRSFTIDAFCRERGITHIDLLKIDVEGAEYQVLLGARRMLEQQQVGCCVFEFGSTTFDMGNTPAMIESYLAQVGYRIRNIVPGNPCFPGRASAMSAQFSIHVAEPK